jgi:peptidoglycan/LPS O-acetylase OafA/YrhL
MDLRRLRAGEWIAAVSGVALLVSLFLPWYGPGNVSGWESLAAIDVLLALVAAAGVLLLVVTAVQSVPAVPIAVSTLVVIAGLVGVLLVLFRVIDTPDGTIGREWALWLGLAGAAGIIVGAALAMRDERLSPPGGHTDLTGRPVAPPAELDPIAPPRT